MKERFMRPRVFFGPGDGGPSTTGIPVPPGPEIVKKVKIKKSAANDSSTNDDPPMPPPPPTRI